MLGTDFPYEYGSLFQKSVDYIAESGLSATDVRRILDTNAAEVLGGKSLE